MNHFLTNYTDFELVKSHHPTFIITFTKLPIYQLPFQSVIFLVSLATVIPEKQSVLLISDMSIEALHSVCIY